MSGAPNQPVNKRRESKRERGLRLLAERQQVLEAKDRERDVAAWAEVREWLRKHGVRG